MRALRIRKTSAIAVLSDPEGARLAAFQACLDAIAMNVALKVKPQIVAGQGKFVLALSR